MVLTSIYNHRSPHVLPLHSPIPLTAFSLPPTPTARCARPHPAAAHRRGPARVPHPAARARSTYHERVPSTSASPAAYTARHLSVLEGLEAVRKRPGMYIRTTDARGLTHCPRQHPAAAHRRRTARVPHPAARARSTYHERVPPTSASPAAYTARHLSVLEGLEAVRKRPGMYIGSTDSRGLMHCLWEIIDNAVDEALEGYGDRIEVILHPDSSVEVRDVARGIPVDNTAAGLSGV